MQISEHNIPVPFVFPRVRKPNTDLVLLVDLTSLLIYKRMWHTVQALCNFIKFLRIK